MENPLACISHAAINNRFAVATGVITDEYFKREVCLDAWRDKFKRRAFPLGQGVNPSYTKTYPTIPTADLTMTAVGLSNCTPGDPLDPDAPYSACDPGTIQIPIQGQDIKTLQLYRSPRIRTQDICLIDLQMVHNPDKAIQNEIDNLMFVTGWYWSRMAHINLLRGVGHKMVCSAYPDGSIPESSGPNFPALFPISHVTQGYLDRIQEDLITLGVGCPGKSGQPIYDLYIGSQASRTMIRYDASIRQDIRYSSEADKLLDGLQGTKGMVYGGYRHNLIAFPMRFDNVAGTLTERYPFGAGVPATYGPKQEVTPEYRNAAYEVCFVIPNDEVMTWLVPPMQMRFNKSTFGGSDTPNYAGDFMWVNVQTDCNIDRSKGFFMSQILTGWDFPNPEYGYALLFKRQFTPLLSIDLDIRGMPNCTAPTLPAQPAPVDPPEPWVDPCLAP